MKKRVLIISAEAWRDEDNGGNVLSNLFAPLMDQFEFAQIYCSPAMPNNDVCHNYFHLSEIDMMKSVVRLKEFGGVLVKSEENIPYVKNEEDQVFTLIKRHRSNLLYLVRDFLWWFSRWKTKDLRKFILDFKPDLIFAPMYGSVYMHWIDRYVTSVTGAKVVSYVSDDHLTLRQHSYSPLFWLNRLRLRKAVFKTAKTYSLLYTMTDEQKKEYEPILKVPMKILKKVGDFSKSDFKEMHNTPYRLLYGGNLSGNRAKTLSAIRDALNKINKDGVIAQLYIYTQTPLAKTERAKLHDGINSFLMGKVSKRQLTTEYAASDILLHVESFEPHNRLMTRMSFSTKIIDLMQACRCIVAICWEESSPYKYLNGNGIGYCIKSEDEIESKLRFLFSHPQMIQDYAKKAWEFGKVNHQSKDITDNLRKDFFELMKN